MINILKTCSSGADLRGGGKGGPVPLHFGKFMMYLNMC